ncbi:MAG: hypothetical protein IAE77_00525 [Prosthecobacter sp.]|uniref:hypothetical protein n=1 Tax=Prosthecobacter sp. TaxID=1965333 RepID=UPI001A01245A|nr:hypothetical protein [Prosthecobacter sp.]MBE2281924.1 hypothetical protein [Prosthecobacter sp.]
MKVPSSQFPVLSLAVFAAVGAFAQDSTTPGEFPKVEAFAALWERSLFTTKDLPAPEDTGGPNFADNLSLSGVYEIDGAVAAVLVDRTTSQVTEVRIGSENELGIKIRQVTPGATVDKTRIQLQKGDKTGWVSFADPMAAQPTEVIQRAVIPTQAGGAQPASSTAPQRRSVNAMPPVNPILPPPSVPIPTAQPTPRAVNDVPLPPP